ncbi:fer-1-like protein 5 [Tiliqua scincoides]|uniref:fer-1-like protein 5 n=1 Tax=Tiliqua scincoides TaxID=71010 RepID=UPI0034636359
MLKIVIVSAYIPPEIAVQPDTCVVATFRDLERRTRVIQKDQHPLWNETLVWYLDSQPLDSTSSVIVQLLEWSTKDESSFGSTNLKLAAVVERPRAIITLKDQHLHNSSLQQTGVRVGIMECRQLQENNVKPVVKVYISHHFFRTRIKSGNSPYYNEMFVQNFQEIPSQFFEESITIQVVNSRALRADSVIGVFKIEIGTVYESPGHALIAKWLSLYDPSNLNAGLKGYVKVNLCVLGAGDRAPDTDTVVESSHLEVNLLKSSETPAARMATLHLYIYGAEDMPQMIPYGLFSREEYETSTILGTNFLNLSQISSTGKELKGDLEGFLPCFGPCFLTLYGSPEEFINSVDPFEKEDAEIEVGVAYRGRVLVEVSTSREEISAPYVDSIPEEMITKMERHLSRHRYGLCAVFYSATMLANIKELIQFEVSIGNYGNKFDITCKPSSSTTQYCHAVYDGNQYYYLPWYDTKPMVAINSLWEDVSYRIACMNTMEFMHSRLKKNLDALRTINTANESVVDVWKKLQRELVEDCKKPFPALDGQAPATVLDHQLRKLRLRLLQQIGKAADKTNAKMPLSKLIAKAEKWLQKIASVTPEMQISIPDVMIWMLCDDKRMAHARVKAHTIMFSKAGPHAKGRLCGKTQTIFLKGMQSKAKYTVIPALLRVRMWLGKLADSMELMKYCEGTILVYAEMYENQRKMHGMWGTRNLMQHPMFSDVTGKVSLPKDKFHPPKGWQWDENWTVEPQRRLLLDTETNHTEVLEEVFENQTRQPGHDWMSAPIPYSNVSGNPVLAMEETVCPPGWYFVEDWNVEVNRAVDDAGWEYGVGIPPAVIPQSWHAAEKTYHTHRRRRWLRKRCRNLNAINQQAHMAKFLQLHSDRKTEEGEVWEYAPLYGWKFHLQQNFKDVFRRRCWRRKLTPVATDHVVAPIFLLEGSLGVEFEKEQMEKEAKKEDDKKKDKKDEEKEKAKEEEGKEENKERKDLARMSSYLLKMNTPLVFCLFKDPVYYQLRCYIFQARDLAGSPTKSSADPLAHVSFVHMSQCTRTHYSTLHPCWDETLIFENILIYGHPEATERDPPIVALEIFDCDATGHSNFFMGRSLCSPTVCLDLNLRKLPPLSKHVIMREQKESGHLLAAFELLLDKRDGSLGKHPPPAWKDGTYTIPKGIRPILRLMAIEILAWGLRSMKNYNLLAISSPSLIIECGGKSIQTPPIKNLQENPNFSINIFLMKVYLPIDSDYSPSIELKVIDHREFGYKPVVGQSTVRNLSQYVCDPWEAGKSHNLPLRGVCNFGLKKFVYKPCSWRKAKKKEGAKEGEEEEEEEVDWWSKYYVTMGDLSKSGNYLQKGFDSVKIYSCELEAVPEFNSFQDFCQTFRLYRGHVKDESIEDPMLGGEFKGLFRIYPLPEDPNDPPPPRQFQELPESGNQYCVVRIYIIRAFNLQPKDRNGLCDPYIRIKIGKKKMGEREDYIPNTLEPTFGRMYELTCSIPVEKDLKISFYDFDVFPPDDLIGDTIIDLENRLLSRYGANCGLSQTYCTSGPSQWRDQLPPTELLKNYVQSKNMPQPEIREDGNQAIFMGKTYQLSDFETKAPSHGYLGTPKERMALHLLHTCGLVPEHIETRTLYSTIHPGIEQGKVQMWIDIFPESLGEPGPPFDITPRKPKKFELRCIIWNTKDVDLEDVNIFGDRMSDIYVKGWMDGMEEEKQRTDVHYRSLAGEGNFNWRFVFNMEYMPMEQICVLTKKQHFWSLDETMQKVPPKLTIQIWDNDKFSADDFIGTLELNLTGMPRPAKRPKDCTVKMLLEDKSTASSFPFHRHQNKHISLFVQKNTRGWWPCIVWENNKPRVSGKIEMTLELLTEKEAEERPAGKGRDEPNMNPVLKPPERPETAFLWYMAPLKSLYSMIWQRNKWKVLIIFCIVFLVLMVATFLYSAPGYLAMKLINPMKGIRTSTKKGANLKEEPPL